MTTMGETCATCRFFGLETGDEEAVCRRFPPFTHHPDRVTYFPTVEAHWWCGEHQPHDAGPQPAGEEASSG